MDLEFRGEVFQWRGPAPFYYVAVPDEESDDIHAVSTRVTYGWGVMLKDAVRRGEQIDDGVTVTVRLSIAM